MWDWYNKPRPRRPANGIRARAQRGQFGQSWWAKKWIEVLESFGGDWASRLQRGRSYARSGQVISIEIEPGKVMAWVQGSARRPYMVTIKLPALTDKQWARAVEAMAGQALFAARLLAGEMPQDIEEAFAAAGVSLFPQKLSELEAFCTCWDYIIPCKHIAAVYYLLGEQFDDDPFMLFTLRGRDKDEVVAAMQARRVHTVAEQDAEEETTNEPAEVAPALADLLDTFYLAGDELKAITPRIAPPELEAPVLRRLGRSPVFTEPDLRVLYRDMTEHVLDKVLGE